MTFREQNIVFVVVFLALLLAFGAGWAILAVLKMLAAGVLEPVIL